MAAANAITEITVEEEGFDRHVVQYTFIVTNFPPIHSLTYMKVWKTVCSPTPTIWRLIVKFIKTGPPVYFTCILTVRRIDIKESIVKISCTLDMLNKSSESVVDTRGFPRTDARFGEEFKLIYDPVLSNRCIEKLPDNVLQVRVRLCVVACHVPRQIPTVCGFTFDDIEKGVWEKQD